MLITNIALKVACEQLKVTKSCCSD